MCADPWLSGAVGPGWSAVRSLGPAVLQTGDAVEYRSAGGVVEAVGDEVAKALELELLVWLRTSQAGLDVGGDGAFAVRIQAGLEVTPARVRLRLCEEAVEQAHFCSHAIGHADPGDGGLDLDSTSVMVPSASLLQPVHSMT